MANMSEVKPDDLADAARLLRAVLDAVEAGELEAGSADAVAMVRRLEGAAVALEAAAEPKNS